MIYCLLGLMISDERGGEELRPSEINLKSSSTINSSSSIGEETDKI